jgi:hypothetical protein
MRLAAFAILAPLFLAACSSRIAVSKPEPAPAPVPKPVGPVATLKIPPGHYPAPGQCRVWYPGRPPGHQPAPIPCRFLQGDVPLGAWVLYRPTDEKKVVRVTAYHEVKPELVVWVRYYDSKTGTFIRAAGKSN